MRAPSTVPAPAKGYELWQDSRGVRWQACSKGLALIRERDGYILVGNLKPGDDVLGERLIILREDGQLMEDGHALTPEERERAVKHILGF